MAQAFDLRLQRRFFVGSHPVQPGREFPYGLGFLGNLLIAIGFDNLEITSRVFTESQLIDS